MLFHTWVIKNYYEDFDGIASWTAKACLARGLKEDRSYFSGKKKGHRYYLKHLESYNASYEVIDAFNECWKQWQKHELHKSLKSL